MRHVPGGLIDGRYQLVDELGRGGIGIVYRAREETTGREVALKLLPAGRARGRQGERFLREGQASASLDHPGIVRVHAYGEWETRPYLVYELVEDARTLDQVFETHSLTERLRLVEEAGRALGYAHSQGMVHRDVKPGNVLVDREGRVRVADFGLAISAGDDRLTRTGELVGTPSYMAPELLSGTVGGETPATDVWALGVILYEAITGALPFEGGNLVELASAIARRTPRPPREWVPSLDRGLEAVCLRALEFEPQRRYTDGTAFAEALSRHEDATPRQQRWVAPTLAVGLLALVLALVLAIGGRLRGDATTPKDALAEAPAAPTAIGRPPAAPTPEPKSDDDSFDVPLATVDDLPLMGKGVFVDEQTLCIATEEGPLLLAFEDDAQGSSLRAIPLKPNEAVEVLVQPGGRACDVFMHIENEPARILRNRSLDQVFGPAKENGVFRFRPTEDVIVAHLTEPRSLGGVPLPSVCAYRDAEVAVYAVVVDAPNDLNVHLLRGAPRAQPETVWSRDFGSRRLGAIALSPRGTYLVLCLRAPGEVLLIDTHEGKLLWSKRLGGPECVAISPDETWAAIGNSSEIVFRFALPGDGSSIPLQREQAGPLDGLVTRSHESTVRGLAFSADGRTLASCSSRITNTPVENELRFWDIATGADLGQWFRTKLPRAPEWLAVSPSGRRLAIGGRAGWVEIRRFSPAER